LAADGVRFTNYFCTVPICSASRASQLTGLYPQSNGLLDLIGFGWRIRDDVQHLSQVLKAAGYRTALFGVQHEVSGKELNRLAFDTVLQPNDTAQVVAARAADYLLREAGSGQPFYAQIGFFETHVPFDRWGTEPDSARGVEVPPYVAEDDSSRRAMAGYQGSVRVVDSAVAMILDALRKSGLEENTLLVLTTDHGIEMPRSKWFLYDPGIAVALILRHPRAGLSGGKVCDALLSNVDYMSTVLDLAGVDVPEGVEGRSFAGALLEESPAPTREAIFGMYHKTGTRCVRTQRFKLIRHFDASTDFAKLPARFDDVMSKRVVKQVELFDLEADPDEFHNVADQPEYAETQRRLDTMLWEWMESVSDPLLGGPVRTPSYEAAIKDYADWKDKRPGRD
jgi:arylsulfatase A-like enzyme